MDNMHADDRRSVKMCHVMKHRIGRTLILGISPQARILQRCRNCEII